jgi:hypothetical protein
LQTLEGHSDGVSSVAFLPGRQLVASASNDRMVSLWGGHGSGLRYARGPFKCGQGRRTLAGRPAGGVGLQRQHGHALGRSHGSGARYDQGLLGLGPEERARFRRQREAEHLKVLITGRQH